MTHTNHQARIHVISEGVLASYIHELSSRDSERSELGVQRRRIARHATTSRRRSRTSFAGQAGSRPRTTDLVSV